MLLASVGVQLPRRLIVEVHLEGGYVLFPVVGLVAGVPAVGISGPWLGAQVSIGLRR